MAVELAKISLWLVSHAEGMPLTFLDHRLIMGDSITGPFLEQLLTYPGSGKQLGNLFHQGLKNKFSVALGDVLRWVQDLEAGVGINLSEIEAKRSRKQLIDEAMMPFRLVVHAWVGGVSLKGAADEGVCDDEAFAALVSAVSDNQELSALIDTRPQLAVMIARGHGRALCQAIHEQSSESLQAHHLLGKNADPEGSTLVPTAPPLSYDLVFPEVFYLEGDISNRWGFDVVLGNPPWDRLLPADKEFFAAFDFRVLNAPTKRERSNIQRALLADAKIAGAYTEYRNHFRDLERLIKRLFLYQVVKVGKKKTIGKQDIFRLFMEKNAHLLSPKGLTGILVPSAFHANEGATGIRRLYLEKMGLICCFSFENRKKLFEIDSRLKFAVVVAKWQGPSESFACGFYLKDESWLFSDKTDSKLIYSLDFVRQTGREFLNFLELRSSQDATIAQHCFAVGEAFVDASDRLNLKLGREVNITDDKDRFTPTAQILPGNLDCRDPEVLRQLLENGYLILQEGKTIHQYDDHWDERPRYIVSLNAISDKPAWIDSSRYFRLAFRAVASSTNERTSIGCVVPPGSIFGNSAPCEKEPQRRPNSRAILILAVINSFAFDWISRQKTSANFNLFILSECPIPPITPNAEIFLIHSALRLTCNHSGYAPLWREQLGHNWLENTSAFTWPVLPDVESRWNVRAAIDAIVANAYGLAREHYSYLLGSFSHSSYHQALALCIQKYDELHAIGYDAFMEKHDPYWNIPLNEELSHPILDFPDYISTRVSEPQKSFQFVDQDKSDEAENVFFDSLLALLREKGVIDSADAQATLNLSAAEVRPLLRRLVDKGWATVEGQKRGTRYIYKQNC